MVMDRWGQIDLLVWLGALPASPLASRPSHASSTAAGRTRRRAMGLIKASRFCIAWIGLPRHHAGFVALLTAVLFLDCWCEGCLKEHGPQAGSRRVPDEQALPPPSHPQPAAQRSVPSRSSPTPIVSSRGRLRSAGPLLAPMHAIAETNSSWVRLMNHLPDPRCGSPSMQSLISDKPRGSGSNIPQHQESQSVSDSAPRPLDRQTVSTTQRAMRDFVTMYLTTGNPGALEPLSPVVPHTAVHIHITPTRAGPRPSERNHRTPRKLACGPEKCTYVDTRVDTHPTHEPRPSRHSHYARPRACFAGASRCPSLQ
ncbi:hypothetical protein F5144DRAFT_221958 [Chaetomium tenue]|uniref:Uncharacterized protein n=1 Tax=Chaetomium tenue TaxID=1854479 RepID=A0ACB7PBH3_9PEZI|nr:hypothetical protein F5144DRAFT_221958 [Chaetomium globosum]